MKLSSLSILIQVYNNEETIGRVLEEAIETGKKYTKNLELIVVDDASQDDSLSVIREYAKRYRQIKIIAHPKNLGFGKTIKESYEKARNDFIFSIPGDRQIRADVLLILLRKITEFDLVSGRRKKRQDSFWRKMQSRIYNSLLRYFGGLKIHDVNSAKLWKRKLLDKITLNCESAFVDAELCFKAQRAGFKMGEVSIPHYPDKAGTGNGASLKTVLPVIKDLVLFFERGTY